MSAKTLKKGDRVAWDTSQGTTTGRVLKKLSAPMKIKGHRAAASTEDPQFLVRTEKSRKLAAHRPEELRKLRPSKT